MTASNAAHRRRLRPNLGLALALGGCAGPAALTVPPLQPPPPSSLPAPAPQPGVLVPALGVRVVLPKGAGGRFDAVNGIFHFEIEARETGLVERVVGPAPHDLEEARKHWASISHGSDVQTVEEGSAGPLFYSLQTFVVRVGVEGRPGLHALARVSRVYASLPVDDASFLRCTVFLEYDVAPLGARTVSADQAVDVCRSMRLAR